MLRCGRASKRLTVKPFVLLTIVGWSLTVAVALVVRNRLFATFVGVLLGIYSLLAIAMADAFPAALFAALHVAVYVNFAALARPRMRPLAYRLLVSWPAAFMVAGTLLALPWAIARALGFHPWGPWIPYAAAVVGLVQSLTTKREEIDLVLDRASVHELRRHPHGTDREDRPLRIVQISDPHLGPFMSVARLRRIAERAVRAKPDLVFLTGDFLTMESHGDPALLAAALSPLAALSDRTFACFGNHDHEAMDHVVRALDANGLRLLHDEAVDVETDAGAVQIVGLDYAFRDAKAHVARVCSAHPRTHGSTRILLLHNPGSFRHVPPGEADLVFSGHTHGGQVGLVSLGLAWTFLRLFAKSMPDHGFWARGTDRLYVHRGTGHYGFPLRLGVPAEESVVRVHRLWA
jgi:uncharacterized protein